MDSINDRARLLVSEFLYEAIEITFQSYKDFMTLKIDDSEPKAFSQYHAAGKSAISHLEALLKLAEKTDLQITSAATDSTKLDKMIAYAQAE
ncbi:MAG: hypothetical protein AAF569_08950, partial [Pseudomonadota bacterium]